MKISTNLWYRADSPYSKRHYNYAGACLFTYRGVEVFQNDAGSWDYVIANATIAQRAGFSAKTARVVIDELLDGKHPCADAVASHLKSCGFTPLTYSQYGEKVALGEMK